LLESAAVEEEKKRSYCCFLHSIKLSSTAPTKASSASREEFLMTWYCGTSDKFAYPA
jgi:hypothetical protein